MKKILIVSDSVMKCTGYGIASRNIINKLLSTNKFEIAQLGLNNASSSVDLPIHYYTIIKDHSRCCGKGSVIEYTRPDKKLVFLRAHPLAVEHPDQRACYKGNPVGAEAYGYNSVYFIINHFKPDIVVPMNDLWGLYNTAYIRNRESYKLVPYLAIDSECMFPVIKPMTPGLPPIDMISTIGSADKVIVWTEWAKEVLNKTCRILFNKEFNNISIIPLGVDTSTWKPLTNRDELRKLNFNIDDNTFLLGCVSRNQPRKRFDAILQTARIFIDKYENKTKKLKIYFHCQPYNDMGWDLPWLAKYYGIDDRCIFNNELRPGEGPSIEHLNELVNCFDAHMLLSNSEGWGLSLIETAAAGIPNITTKYSAMADWGKDTLLFAKVAAYEHEAKTGFVKALVDVEHAAKQLQLLYASPKMCREYGTRGVKLGQKLDWNKVTDKWVELLDSIPLDFKEDRFKDLDPEKIAKDLEEIQNQQLNLRYMP